MPKSNTKTVESGSANVRSRKKNKKKGAGFLSSLFLVLAIACFLYAAPVLLILGFSHWFNFAWLIAGVLCIIFSFVFSAHSHVPAVLKGVLGLIIAAVIVHFAVFEANVIKASSSYAEPDAKWVIVLGAKVNGDTPSVEFRSRLEKAAAYIRDCDAVSGSAYATVITTGGQGPDEGAAEAAVGARVLKGLRVSGDRILIEDKSTTTQENLQFAKEIIAQNGGTMYDKVVIVTSGFHLYRAGLLAEAEGYHNVQGAGSRGLAVLVPHYYAREYAAYVKEFFMHHFE